MLIICISFLILPACSNAISGWKNDPDGDGITKGINDFAKSRPATGNKVFIFDPNSYSWAAYDENGQRVNTGKASGGANYCPDIDRACRTPVGSYKVVREGSESCKSGTYPIKTGGGAPMPYCMHFGHVGYAIHASNDVPDNRNASHGCIRVTYKSAKWLNKEFIDVGTEVIVLPYK